MIEAHLKRLGPNPNVKVLKMTEDCTKSWIAGRGSCCHIYTKSKYASRKHFCISYRDNNYFISDLQSANGTFLNDERIIHEKKLEFGSVISVGVPSNMQNIPDCVVYVFEIHSTTNVNEKTSSINDLEENDIVIVKEIYDQSSDRSLANKRIKVDNNDNKNYQLSLEKNNFFGAYHSSNEDCDNVALDSLDLKTATCVNDETVVSSMGNVSAINSTCSSLKRIKEECEQMEEKPAKVKKYVEKTTVQISNTLPLNEIPNATSEETSLETQPGCIQNMNEKNNKHENENSDEAYNMLTQIDENTIKSESDFLNYSQAEELIEISDSEEEVWMPKNIECKENICCDEELEDDVIFIEIVTKTKITEKNLPKSTFLSNIEDTLTETDKKWMEKLLKIKKEPDILLLDNKVTPKIQDIEIIKEENKETNKSIVVDSLAKDILSTNILKNEQTTLLSSHCIQIKSSMPTNSENLLQLKCKEMPVSPVNFLEKKLKGKEKFLKKSVRFDLVPKIKYIEIDRRVKLTTVEKGNIQFTRVIYNICNWNTVWLEECKKVASEKDPPDICDKPLRKIPQKFTSHTEYMSAFIPVMLLQLWSKVKESWKKYGHSAFRQTVSCDSFEDYETGNLCVCKCTGLVQGIEIHRSLLREGHLVMLRLHQVQDAKLNAASQKYSKKLGYLVFGFLESKIYERFNNQPLHEALAERCSSAHGELYVVKLTFIVKKRPNLQLDRQKLIQMTVVHHISSDIKTFRAVCLLPKSPLCKAILRPTKEKFLLAIPSEINNFAFKGPLDSHQKELVSRLVNTCTCTDSFFYSIHGAAGTGKGHVVIAFILQLLCGTQWKKNEKPKIIYCTYSSVPLDEMVAKLKTYRENIGTQSKFSLVRVGPVKEVKAEVKEFCLSNLTQTQRFSKSSPKENRTNDADVRILEESDVICATSASTGMKKMAWAFEKMYHRNKSRKIICILDEAMHTREPDSLIPLLLGVTHLFLVGDVYQFEPSFSCEKAHLLGLDISLLRRVHRNFVRKPKDSWPIHILKIQHRMNPSLSRFVNKIIYNKHLPDNEGDAKITMSSLRNYLLLIDPIVGYYSEVEKENRKGRIVFQLIKALIKFTNARPINFFVITGDTKESELIQSLVCKSKYPEVEINLVHKFQGREADIVLFLYDGNKFILSQIAVAMTRAKNSLIILATQESIENDLWFPKVLKDAKERKALKFISPGLELEMFEHFVKK